MKKKISALLVAVIILSFIGVKKSDAIAGFAVAAIVGASALFAGSSLLIPSLVRENTTGKSAWVAVPVAIANAATLAAKMSIAGILAGGSYFRGLLDGWVNPDGKVTRIVNNAPGYNQDVLHPPGGYVYTSINGSHHVVGTNLSSEAAYTAANSACLADHPPSGCSGGAVNCPFAFCGYRYWTQYWTSEETPRLLTDDYLAFTSGTTTQEFAAYGVGDLSGALSTAAAADDPKAKDVIVQSTRVFGVALDGRTPSEGAVDADSMSTGRSILDAAVTQANVDIVQARTAPSGAQTAADIEAARTATAAIQNADLAAAIAAANPALTASQVQAAVKAALDDETGFSEPVEPTIVNPEKKNLTGVMGAFMTAVNSLPILDAVRGINVNLSGATSVICLPNAWGSEACYDASKVQGSLNMVGSGLLSIVTIFSIIGVFKG